MIRVMASPSAETTVHSEEAPKAEAQQMVDVSASDQCTTRSPTIQMMIIQ